MFSSDSFLYTQLLEKVGENDIYNKVSYCLAEANRLNGKFVYFKFEMDGEFAIFPFIEREFLVDGTVCRDLTMAYGYPCAMKTKNYLPSIELSIKELQAASRSEGYVSLFMRNNPLVSQSLDLSNYELVGESVYLDLTLDNETRLASYRKVHRRDVKNSSSKNLSCSFKPFGVGDIDIFSSLYSNTMDRLDANSDYYFTYKYFKALVDSPELDYHLAISQYNEEVLTMALFSICGEIMQYHLSCSSNSKLRGFGSKLVIETAAARGKDAGCSVLNLGGGLGGRADSLFDFKAGFSSLRARNYIYKSVVDEEIYEKAVAEKSNKSPIGTRFPQYR